MIKAGLTGGIASGKSEAANIFAREGAAIVDADVLSRDVLKDDRTVWALEEAFPTAFTGGVLDRAALRRLVFADDDKRETLDRIMHPAIYAAAKEALANSNAAVTVLVAPLLFEAGFADLVDSVVTVACPEAIRIARLIKRDTISETLAKRMIAAQLSDDERAKRADVVLVNDGNLEKLEQQIVRLYKEWTK